MGLLLLIGGSFHLLLDLTHIIIMEKTVTVYANGKLLVVNHSH